MTLPIGGWKFFIRTFGCQMNENDSEHLAGLLAAAGGEPAKSPEMSDLTIVNTCAVREKSEDKLTSYLGRLASLKKKRPLLVGVAGCVAEIRAASLLDRFKSVDFIIGPHQYHRLPDLLAGLQSGRIRATGWDEAWRDPGSAGTLRESSVSGYVTVMEGCNNFCSYCIVPFARGREKFRPREAILREVEDLGRLGYLEVQLLGQNVNSYRDPRTGRGFAELLDEVARVEGPAWIRFITSHPRDFGEEIMDAMRRNSKVCRQLHLPIQSGSDAVLRRMNRGYGRDAYLEKIERLRTLLPGIALTTDVIVGFPGETEQDFEDTLDVLRRVEYTGIFSFRYSPRPMTAASRLPDDVSPEEKRRRLAAVQGLQKEIQLRNHRELIGSTLTVLGLGRSKKDASIFAGRTEGAQVVNFTASREALGRFARVRVLEAGPYSLRGAE